MVVFAEWCGRGHQPSGKFKCLQIPVISPAHLTSIMCKWTRPFFQGKIIYAPPPFPHFWPKGIFQGRGGGGVYFEAPRGINFIRPPLFIHPPAPRRVFSGVGGVGVYKIWPRNSGDRLPEGTQKPLLGPGSPPLQRRH